MGLFSKLFKRSSSTQTEKTALVETAISSDAADVWNRKQGWTVEQILEQLGPEISEPYLQSGPQAMARLRFDLSAFVAFHKYMSDDTVSHLSNVVINHVKAQAHVPFQCWRFSNFSVREMKVSPLARVLHITFDQAPRWPTKWPAGIQVQFAKDGHSVTLMAPPTQAGGDALVEGVRYLWAYVNRILRVK